jgi:pyruvate-formate lyase-activating enzyme
MYINNYIIFRKKDNMKIKTIIDEDISNYKKMSMFIGTCKCDFKCCTEIGEDICMCQNSEIAKQKTHTITNEKIIKRYLENCLTSAIVFGGLEPFLQFDELYEFIEDFRKESDDDIVIYTGYYENELANQIEKLKRFKNIIIKFGRFIPGQRSHLDKVLKVRLANKEQYAKKIS